MIKITPSIFKITLLTLSGLFEKIVKAFQINHD